MIGDVLFFRRTNTFISKAISALTKGEYTHVGLIVAFDGLTGVATIVESDRFVATRINQIVLDKNNHSIFTTPNPKPEEVVKKIVKFGYDSIGKKYDYIQILGILLSLLFKNEKLNFFNSQNKLICSELIDLAYFNSGVERRCEKKLGNVLPQELINAYGLKEIKKEV